MITMFEIVTTVEEQKNFGLWFLPKMILLFNQYKFVQI